MLNWMTAWVQNHLEKRHLDIAYLTTFKMFCSWFFFFSIQYIGSKKIIQKPIAQQKYPKNNESQITFLSSVVAERIYPATRQCFIVFKGKKNKGAATYHNFPLLCNNNGTNTTWKPVRWDSVTSGGYSLTLLLVQGNLKFCGELGANIAAAWSKP